MTYTTLISTTDLAAHLFDPDWALFDCRFSLADPERGRQDYKQEHIPGALYAHLNKDLSGPAFPGVTGRHPVPSVDELSAQFSKWGIDQHVQVIAYDDSGGSIAGRLWWLLNWLGHEAVAVLDGDWRKWKSEGQPTSDGIVIRTSRFFVPHPREELLSTTAEIESQLGANEHKLIDARLAERYSGEKETIDPVAGHIPGAINAPYPDNLGPDGTFLPAAELRARYVALLGDTPAAQSTFYCGSGVTAAHDLLAIKHAGLGDAKLYAGSWSEWITDPKRPIEK